MPAIYLSLSKLRTNNSSCRIARKVKYNKIALIAGIDAQSCGRYSPTSPSPIMYANATKARYHPTRSIIQKMQRRICKARRRKRNIPNNSNTPVIHIITVNAQECFSAPTSKYTHTDVRTRHRSKYRVCILCIMTNSQKKIKPRCLRSDPEQSCDNERDLPQIHQ